MEEETENKKTEKIKTLKSAGYTDKEISELIEDGYDFDEAAWLVKNGHSKAEISKSGTLELMKKVMAETSWDAQQKNGGGSD